MTFDNDNRIATFKGPSMGSPASVGYDTDGNLTSGPLTNDTFVTYGYDARNRLTNADGTSYTYDPAGNRVGLTNGANATRFVVNPNAALSQMLMRVRSGVTNYYIYGLGLLYEVTETASSTNTLTYHYDYRGSTVALTDSSGNVTDRIEYSPYATTTYRAGTNNTLFLFNGRYGVQTDSNGLLYMRARYYNPYLCRFLNADPAGFSGGLNFYAYADGNPISLIDPFGLGAWEPDNSWFRVPENRGQPCIECHGVSYLGFRDSINNFSGLTTIPRVTPEASLAMDRWADSLQEHGPELLAQIGTAEIFLALGMASPRTTAPVNYTEADVRAAMVRLEARGIATTEVQSSVDPNQVIRIGQAMNSGAFRNELMDSPVIFSQPSQAFMAGNHRAIAAEMTGFNLNVNRVNIVVTPQPFSSVSLQTGRVNPPIRVP